MSLHVIVIGAGLAGLSAAVSTKVANPSHSVTILESVKELAEVGAGLQLTPNATRLFKTWGIDSQLSPLATTPTSLSVHRYDGSLLLANSPNFQDEIHSRYGSPFWGMHRVDLQRALASRAAQLGIQVRLNSKVTSVSFDTSTVTLSSGETIAGDVVLCADGLWSATRSQFLGTPSPAIHTGDLAYRIVISQAELHGPDAEELRQFVAGCTVNFWVGPGTHVVSYSVRSGESLNIVLLCPDDLPKEVAKQEGDLEEMRALFGDWDPILRKFLEQVKSVQKWRLMWCEPLPEWTNDEGTFIMLGDSCHPMLPYLAQGANSSLEDGAVLGWLLGKVTKGENQGTELRGVKRIYEELRKDRGEKIAKETWKQREDFHMPDGEKQRERDKLMLSMLGGELKADFPSRWTCPRVQRWLYGYDAYAEVEKAFEKTPF